MSTIIDKLDQIDIKILKILQEDGGISNLDLSGRVGLSTTPTFERVKKLQKMKVIKGYHASLDSNLLGFGIQTFMLVTLAQTKGNSVNSFIKQVEAIDEIVECYRLTGKADYMFKIIVKDIAAYEKLATEKIRAIKEVGNFETMVILSTVKKSAGLPIRVK